MKRKLLLLKTSFILLLLVAVFHTFFIVIGGPDFPDTQEFNQMRELMGSVRIDSGGGIFRTMQNFMDGFNMIVSVFLLTLPVLSLSLLSDVKENEKAIQKLTLISLAAVFAFFLISFTYLAIGGTVIAGMVSVLLAISLFMKN